MPTDDLDPEKALAWLRDQSTPRKKKSAKKAEPEVVRVLAFAFTDLLPLVDRLAEFAANPPGEGKDCDDAVRLGARLRRLAGILALQDESTWIGAARFLRGRKGKSGWSQACWNIALSSEARDLARQFADRLEDAGLALDACGGQVAAPTRAALARRAAHALLEAGGLWNETQQWQKSLDKAAREGTILFPKGKT
jgi:hypothetical protein